MRDSNILNTLSPYDPKYINADVLLSANENPLDVCDEIKEAIVSRLPRLPFNRYPQPTADVLRGIIAANLPLITQPTQTFVFESCDGFSWPEFTQDNIVVGNGGDELLFNTLVAFGGPGNKLLITPPTFSVYKIDAQMTNTEVVEVPRNADFTLNKDAILQRAAADDINVIVLTSPNNPTGDCVDLAWLEQLLQNTNALIVMDEAYGEFSGQSSIPLIAKYPNLCVLRTFSKAYALAGVRLGYIIASPKVIDKYMMCRQPYSVDAVSQVIGEEVASKPGMFSNSIQSIIRRRDELTIKLMAITGVEVFPSRANFIMVRVAGAEKVWHAMVYDDSVLVRDFSRQKYLEGCLRITVGTEEENQAMLDSLASNIVKGL